MPSLNGEGGRNGGITDNMGDLLSGLESMGLGNLKGMSLFGEEKKEEAKTEEVKKGPSEADFIFDKTYECPVCDQEFKAKTIRTGKVKLTTTDVDLRPIYQEVDCLKYDAVACPICGYASIAKFFNTITGAQAKLVRENISNSFKGLGPDPEVYSYDDAIARHKLALVNTMVKRARSSEKAYTCLKTAWLLRGKAENLPDDTPNFEEVTAALHKEEVELLGNAYTGFMDAFSKEGFPICGMDEITLTYLLAELARRVGKNEESLRWVSRVLISKNASERIKSRAREIKELITGEAG